MKSSIPILLALLSTTAHAFDPSSGPHCDPDSGLRFCLTSFIWCEHTGNGKDDCFYPENVYSLQQTDYDGAPAILTWGYSYIISWKGADPDYPVNIAWSFPNETERNSISYKWEYNTTIPPPTHYIWTLNSTAMFPNPLAPNMSSAAARGNAEGVGNLRVSQPEKAAAMNATVDEAGVLDASSDFITIQGWSAHFANNRVIRTERAYEHAIRLGVGIGVGLGVPFMMALAAGGTWWVMRKKIGRANKIEG
ncbi:hypothetical protein K402DRAFT_398488 [Aulographum hederae CBS 113979]|uniref:Uncharacterized protein n=1 Tax=Aulographum hederae CBS 113979 TaxID=1176131 RepID=A0A6G1GL73_9PEZI|nr:hypothetical protein K402DRAFT_398488 [Aulographum hederae CBS 113979]